MKYFLVSLIINLVILYLFTTFVMKPMNEAAKIIAKGLCISWHQKCEFDK